MDESTRRTMEDLARQHLAQNPAEPVAEPVVKVETEGPQATWHREGDSIVIVMPIPTTEPVTLTVLPEARAA